MKLFLTALCLIALSGSAVAQPPTSPAVPVWVVDRPKSSIQLKGFSKKGQPFTIFFQSWSAEIAFDPAHPELSKATVTIDTRSGSTGAATYRDYLVTPAWFDPEQVPYAQFHMSSFSKMSDTAYQANGVLNLYNQPKTIVMPFPGIGIPFQAKFKEVKNKPTQAEFTSNFTFAVPDFSPAENPASVLKRPMKKINFIMTLKASKATKPAEAQKPKGK